MDEDSEFVDIELDALSLLWLEDNYKVVDAEP